MNDHDDESAVFETTEAEFDARFAAGEAVDVNVPLYAAVVAPSRTYTAGTTSAAVLMDDGSMRITRPCCGATGVLGRSANAVHIAHKSHCPRRHG